MKLKRLRNINGIGFTIMIAVTCSVMTFAEMTDEPPMWVLRPLSLATYLSVLLFFANTIRTLLMRDRYEHGFTDARLTRDIFLSLFAAIISAAGVYHIYGYTIHGGVCPAGPARLDEAIYLATVSFTTLGYGEFLPCPGWSRFTSGSLALVGNLHLAFLVSLTMVIIGKREKTLPRP